MKDVKIIIGANYGDEGKGLVTRHFSLDDKKKGQNPIVIFHNGTAQRGHTVDYNEDLRHVYHHFGSGTGDGVPTFFAKDFFIHPMEYHREYCELTSQGIQPPATFFDPNAKVVTPFDMVVDRATEEWIAKYNGEREFGSCGMGTWCAIEDRYPMGKTNFTISDYTQFENVPQMLEYIWKDCLSILIKRGVDIKQTSFAHILKNRSVIVNNFIEDLKFFFYHSSVFDFHNLFNNTKYDSFIFENGQGLGLDVNIDNDWHTTSNTGLINPYNMLKDENGYNAEVCYVTRSYITRHGIGPNKDISKKDINNHMYDKTNVFNEFQGDLRYAYFDKEEIKNRINKDYSIAINDKRYYNSITITHTNEFDCEYDDSKYYSDNPFDVKERK